MRKVLRNTDEVIHVFAQQTQSEGRNQSGSIFFYIKKLFLWLPLFIRGIYRQRNYFNK